MTNTNIAYSIVGSLSLVRKVLIVGTNKQIIEVVQRIKFQFEELDHADHVCDSLNDQAGAAIDELIMKWSIDNVEQTR